MNAPIIHTMLSIFLMPALLILACFVAALLLFRRWRRAVREGVTSTRIFRGLCPQCGYDLAGSTSTARCPECGREFTPEDRQRLENIAPALLRARDEQAAQTGKRDARISDS